MAKAYRTRQRAVLTPPPARPDHLALALRNLVNLSRACEGPALAEAYTVTQQLELPAGWLEALLVGWRTGVRERINAAGQVERLPFHAALIDPEPVRYLHASMLPDLRPEGRPKAIRRVCRLCGGIPPKAGRRWHPECAAAFLHHSSRGWEQLCQQVLERDGGRCQACGIDVRQLSPLRSESGRQLRPWAIHHVRPLADGGEHTLENLALLCAQDHWQDHAGDGWRRRQQALEAAGQLVLFGSSVP